MARARSARARRAADGADAADQRGGSPGPSRSRSRVVRALPYAIIVLGLAALMWPVATSWLEAWEASRNIDSVLDAYGNMDDPARQAVWDEALLYNEALASGGDLSARAPYTEQLAYGGSEMIAYISIPKCSVRLPIFHGTEDKALMAGVGHLDWTSLPCGGASTHCVLTAHTGIPGRRMFDDIGLLAPGDEFVVWTLGEALAYRVTGTEKVLPSQVESLAIEPGRDLCTLVTCTPYGVNSHRLLVHAERCAYVPGEEEMPSAAVYLNQRTAPLLVAIAVVLALAAGWAWRRRRRRGARARAKNLSAPVSFSANRICELRFSPLDALEHTLAERFLGGTAPRYAHNPCKGARHGV